MKILITALVTALVVGAAVSFGMIKRHHGEMNVRVGYPYAQLVERMHELAKQGDTNGLGRLIDKMYERRADIAGAWLYDDDRFREFVRQETGGNPPVR